MARRGLSESQAEDSVTVVCDVLELLLLHLIQTTIALDSDVRLMLMTCGLLEKFRQ